MNRLILITGDLAAGKTTFSKILSEKLNIICFNKDYLKERLADTIGFTNREENLKLSKASFKIMEYIFSSFAKLNNDLMLEANFKNDELDVLKQIALKNNYQVLTLVFYGEDEILYQRFMNRVKNEHRHPCHISGDLTDKKVFIDYLNKGRKTNYFSKVINIDSSNFNNIDIKTIIDECNNL